MRQEFEDIYKRYKELEEKLSKTSFDSDTEKYVKVSQEFNSLSAAYELISELKK